MPPDPIVLFYSSGVDHRGRTLAAIRSWSDADLEAVHDYIQWMFPTVQPSGVNPSAPLVTKATIQAFEADPALRDRLRQSLDRMLAFYGLRRTVDATGGVRVEIDESRVRERAGTWLTPGNHNHLRLTRIVDSLSTLGLRAEALALQRCLLTDICEGPGRDRITPQTLRFWRAAARPD